MIFRFRWTPARLAGLSFISLILLGTFFLFLPAATSELAPARLIDALFTATSSVCVTGLIVQDTAKFFSPFGQIVILILIQIGGLGIMTLSAALPVLFGQQLKLSQRNLFQALLEQSDYWNLREILKGIIRYTFFIEFAGAVILSTRWYFLWGDLKKSIFFGIFHSISAFCNAGFSLFSDGLVRFRDDPVINVTILSLIILGGLGFIVIRELVSIRRWSQFSLHAKLVLFTTSVLIVGPFLFFFFAEYSTTFLGWPLADKLWVSFFQSVTTRTAGFNTMDIATLSRASIFLMGILMFIGAGPGGTAGGVKVSTMGLLFLSIRAHFSHRDQIEILGRRISSEIVNKSIAIVSVSFSIVTIFMILLMLLENFSFQETFFEVTSAFGTVGLTLGITPELSDIGKLLISTLMFIGRLGPLSLVFLLRTGSEKINYRLPSGNVLVG